jgi:hypothetical protein
LPARTTQAERNAAHWKRLGLIPGAPECVIKAAHRAQIELHHPDRGGDANVAKQINVAYDELRGSGAAANEYVAANYNGEPWVVLGITSAADGAFAERAGKQLQSELAAYPRLVARVRWAIDNFSRVKPTRVSETPRAASSIPPQPRRVTPDRSAHRPPPEPAKPAAPEGLPAKIDFGTLQWRGETMRTIQLTWKRFAPYSITVETAPPVRAEVVASKVLPGRFSVTFSIDWDSPELAGGPTVRGYTLDAAVTVRWTATDAITIPARGLIMYPALVSASPMSFDLGTVEFELVTRISLMLVSSAATSVTIEPPAWLQRVDGRGQEIDAPLKLATNVPVRVELRVHWAPVAERAAASFETGRPVRPTGRIIVRWGERELEIPAEMVVPPPPRRRR